MGWEAGAYEFGSVHVEYFGICGLKGGCIYACSTYVDRLQRLY